MYTFVEKSTTQCYIFSPTCLLSVTVIYCFITNYPQCNGLKQQHLFCSSIRDFSRCGEDSSSLLRPTEGWGSWKAPLVSGGSHWPSPGAGVVTPPSGFYMWLRRSFPARQQLLGASTPRSGWGPSAFYGFTSKATRHHFYHNHRPSDAPEGNIDTSVEKLSVANWDTRMSHSLYVLYVHTAVFGKYGLPHSAARL